MYLYMYKYVCVCLYVCVPLLFHTGQLSLLQVIKITKCKLLRKSATRLSLPCIKFAGIWKIINAYINNNNVYTNKNCVDST